MRTCAAISGDRLSSLQKSPQLFASHSGFFEQGDQGPLGNLPIVPCNHSSAFRRGIVKDVMASAGVIQRESKLLQEANQLSWFNGG
jgi:hypothetical protein